MKRMFSLFLLILPVYAQAGIVLVTGGSSGIGKAIAERFASEGKTVIVADIKKVEFENDIEFIYCDVGSQENVVSLFENIGNRKEPLEGVVQNAAIAIYKNHEEYTLEEWNEILGVNINGIFLVSKYAIPFMKAEKKGWMTLIGSVHARTTSTMNSAYAASKGAVVVLTKALALECAPYGIRVNAISPGAINTPMLTKNWPGIKFDENHPLVGRIPMKRIGNPEEIASVAYFLASKEASYITGAEIVADGGLSIHFD